MTTIIMATDMAMTTIMRTDTIVTATGERWSDFELVTSGPVESDVASTTVIPVGAQAFVMAPTVAACRGLGDW